MKKLKQLKRIMVVFLIIFACAGCDQSTKYIAATQLELNEVSSYAGDLFRLHYVENKGAFLGVGDRMSDQLRFIVFTLLVALILGVILAYIIYNSELSKPSVVAYAAILGGGLSNLYDRVANDGAVVDFLNVGIGSLRTGIFNVADVFIMLGMVMLLIRMLAATRNSE